VHSLNRRSLLQLMLGAIISSDEISTPLGRLHGTQNANARIFLGIPFAQPPVGILRFRAPLPARPWRGVRAATTQPPAPMQAGPEQISEDCLYLNVFAPKSKGPHPVFVWIYGGGNNAGSASNPSFEGSNFARDGVVCVVINYRVGALGFLELGDGSGNNGIRDQVQALRWVRENIASFGGDPQQVTVGGQSAGAKNVAALMASPDAKGLFQRAIMESGSAQTVHTTQQAQVVTAMMMKQANVSANQLRALDVHVLLEAQRRVLAAYPANYPFRPVVDGSFLPDVPLKQIAKGSAVDLLLGTNRDEMVAFLDPAHAAEPLNQKELGNMRIEALTPLEGAYKSAFPALSIADIHIRMLTAEEYWIPSVRIAEVRSGQRAQTFMYRFDHSPARGPFAKKSAHGSESPFVWDHAKPETQALAAKVHAAWVAFIRGGHPQATGLPSWPVYQTAKRETMILDDQSHVEPDPNRAEREIWNNRL
jgi:para-nitrobenzyl esterase